MIKKIYNTIKQWSVVRWCTKWVAWCFRWLCFIARSIWRFFIRHILDRLLISIIFVGGVIMLALAVRLFWAVRPIWRGDILELHDSYDLLRGLIWSMGGLGAAIGLWFASQRQKALSKQVQVQVGQDFNDRLGRGVELLAKEDIVMRCAGVQILRDLTDNANDRQKPIVAKIIYDFFCDNARVKYDSNKNHCARHEADSIQDLQDALDMLINLPLDLRIILREGRGDDLDFRSLDFSYLTLKCEKLEQVDFSNSCFFKTDFFISNLENATFQGANFMDVVFNRINFKYIHFWDAHFTDVKFRYVRFANVLFWETYFKDVKFNMAYFVGGEFQSECAIRVFSYSDLPRFICSKIEAIKFEFSDDIDRRRFFEACYYYEDDWLPDDNNPIDVSRGCEEGADGFEVFVKSEKPWSGQPAEEWVAMELVERKLKRAKNPLLRGKIDAKKVTEAESELAVAKKELQRAQERLKKAQDDPNSGILVSHAKFDPFG